MCVFIPFLAHSKSSHIWHNPLSMYSVPGPMETEICMTIPLAIRISHPRDGKNKIIWFQK